MADQRYMRRVSGEEAREGYVLILKNHLDRFPPIGRPFDLVYEGRRASTRVVAVPCTCRGPDLPHDHYRFHWPGLRAGDRITVIRDAQDPDSYAVHLERRRTA